MAGELVLVIDDSPTITKVVQLVLTKAALEAIEATYADHKPSRREQAAKEAA